MKTMDDLRLTLSGLGRDRFTIKELIEEHQYVTFVYRQVNNLVSNEEVERIPDTRPAEYKIIKLKDTKAVKQEKRTIARIRKNDFIPSSPWACIFPEFYTLPRFSGKSRVYINFTE